MYSEANTNEGKEAPFPAGYPSRGYQVDVIARAYDLSGAFNDVWTAVVVS